MISACMLIRTEKGKFKEVVRRLKQIQGVKVAFPVLGRFDVAVDIEAPSSKKLGETIMKANRLAGIVFTETLPEVEA
jgi:uncharacterized protein with GYD domain